MTLKEEAPARVGARNRGESSPETDQISDGQDLVKIPSKHSRFNDLPLWRAAREYDLRRLPPASRHLARRFGLDPSTAVLVARLAGLGDGGRHD